MPRTAVMTLANATQGHEKSLKTTTAHAAAISKTPPRMLRVAEIGGLLGMVHTTAANAIACSPSTSRSGPLGSVRIPHSYQEPRLSRRRRGRGFEPSSEARKGSRDRTKSADLQECYVEFASEFASARLDQASGCPTPRAHEPRSTAKWGSRSVEPKYHWGTAASFGTSSALRSSRWRSTSRPHS